MIKTESDIINKLNAYKIILQAIDSPRRDFEWRLFMAKRLMDEGYASIIGSKSQIKEIHKRSENCIFLGRLNSNTARSEGDKKFITEMKERNTALFFIHDEGGFYLKGHYEASVRRIYPEEYFGLDIMKKVFFWGAAQQKVFKSHPWSSKFCVSGAPRFDLYSSNESEKSISQCTTESVSEENYVLVATRFPSCNKVDEDPGALSARAYQIKIEGGALASQKNKILKDSFDSWGKVTYEFSRFIPSIAKLFIDFPSINFVIRPHPAERESFYKEAFGHFENVVVDKKGDVRAALLRCKAIIHCECTTGIEAMLAGKRSINFRPTRDIDEFSAYHVAGVCDVGIQVANYDELKQSLSEILIGNAYYNEDVTQHSAHRYLANLSHEKNATDIIIEEIKKFTLLDDALRSNIIVKKSRSWIRILMFIRKSVKRLNSENKSIQGFGDSKEYVFSELDIKKLWRNFGGSPDSISIQRGLVYTFPNDSHRALTVIQSGICDGDQLGTRPNVGRGMGVL